MKVVDLHKILLEITAEIVVPLEKPQDISKRLISVMEIIAKEFGIENEKLDRQLVFSTFIQRGNVFVTAFPHEKLRVPKGLGMPVVLEYGLNMANPIPDLKTDEDGIHATLSFNRTPTETFVPWASVGCIELYGFGIRWPEVLSKFGHLLKTEEEEVEEKVEEPKQPRLRLV